IRLGSARRDGSIHQQAAPRLRRPQLRQKAPERSGEVGQRLRRRTASHRRRQGHRDLRSPQMSAKLRIEIEFCMQYRWLLRAAWVAQELITTFDDQLGEVAQKPGTGGVFRIRLGDELLADRK